MALPEPAPERDGPPPLASPATDRGSDPRTVEGAAPDRGDEAAALGGACTRTRAPAAATSHPITDWRGRPAACSSPPPAPPRGRTGLSRIGGDVQPLAAAWAPHSDAGTRRRGQGRAALTPWPPLSRVRERGTGPPPCGLAPQGRTSPPGPLSDKDGGNDGHGEGTSRTVASPTSSTRSEVGVASRGRVWPRRSCDAGLARGSRQRSALDWILLTSGALTLALSHGEREPGVEPAPGALPERDGISLDRGTGASRAGCGPGAGNGRAGRPGRRRRRAARARGWSFRRDRRAGGRAVPAARRVPAPRGGAQ